MQIIEDDLQGAEIRRLVRLHLEGMRASSPACSVHALDVDALRSPDVTFWSAWDGDLLLGCGALKEVDSTHGEVKSMRTVAAHLGRGVGAAILTRIIDTARARGYARVSLETGSGEAFDAACRLYERFGFEPCGPFGDYPLDDPFSRFYTLAISDAG